MRFMERVKAVINRRNEPRWGSIRQEPPERQQSASMERHPHSWAGIDRDGNAKSGETLMRDKTVGAMIEGFYAAGYQKIRVTRDGIEYEGVQRQPS